MELNRLLKKRRNVYGFLPQSFPNATLARILENALHVPSAGFTQDFDFIVVVDKATKKKLADASLQEQYNKLKEAINDFIAKAPVIVIPCANKVRFEMKYGKPAEKNARLPWWLIDAGFASLVLILSAFQEGLAASFLGALEDDKVIDILSLPNDGSIIPLAVIPIGYPHPQEEGLHKTVYGQQLIQRRRSLEDVLHWNKW